VSPRSDGRRGRGRKSDPAEDTATWLLEMEQQANAEQAQAAQEDEEDWAQRLRTTRASGSTGQFPAVPVEGPGGMPPPVHQPPGEYQSGMPLPPLGEYSSGQAPPVHPPLADRYQSASRMPPPAPPPVAPTTDPAAAAWSWEPQAPPVERRFGTQAGAYDPRSGAWEPSARAQPQAPLEPQAGTPTPWRAEDLGFTAPPPEPQPWDTVTESEQWGGAWPFEESTQSWEADDHSWHWPTQEAPSSTGSWEVDPSVGREGSLPPQRAGAAEGGGAATGQPATGAYPPSGGYPGAGAYPPSGDLPATGAYPASGSYPRAGDPPASGGYPAAGDPPAAGAYPGAGAYPPAGGLPASGGYSATDAYPPVGGYPPAGGYAATSAHPVDDFSGGGDLPRSGEFPAYGRTDSGFSSGQIGAGPAAMGVGPAYGSSASPVSPMPPVSPAPPVTGVPWAGPSGTGRTSGVGSLGVGPEGIAPAVGSGAWAGGAGRLGYEDGAARSYAAPSDGLTSALEEDEQVVRLGRAANDGAVAFGPMEPTDGSGAQPTLGTRAAEARRSQASDEHHARPSGWPRVVALISWVVLLMVLCWFYVFPWLERILPENF
jgi:hypothetical protein